MENKTVTRKLSEEIQKIVGVSLIEITRIANGYVADGLACDFEDALFMILEDVNPNFDQEA